MTRAQAMANAPADRAATVDAPDRGALRLELRVGELRQLFNSMDAAPFRERDLDPAADEFIVEWAREQRAAAPLALCVNVARGGDAQDAPTVREAIHEYYSHAAAKARRRLKQLFSNGRWSLVIGVLFVAVAQIVSDLMGAWLGDHAYGRTIEESIAIGSWVALWRPTEIFLYDWWPIRNEARLYDRLADMPVDVTVAAAEAR